MEDRAAFFANIATTIATLLAILELARRWWADSGQRPEASQDNPERRPATATQPRSRSTFARAFSGPSVIVFKAVAWCMALIMFSSMMYGPENGHPATVRHLGFAAIWLAGVVIASAAEV